ncbi:hypothetical protein C8J57DRAFT_1710449, partial [Mycena rebaudengoi]
MATRRTKLILEEHVDDDLHLPGCRRALSVGIVFGSSCRWWPVFGTDQPRAVELLSRRVLEWHRGGNKYRQSLIHNLRIWPPVADDKARMSPIPDRVLRVNMSKRRSPIACRHALLTSSDEAHRLFMAALDGHFPILRRLLTSAEKRRMASGDVYLWETTMPRRGHRGSIRRFRDGMIPDWAALYIAFLESQGLSYYRRRWEGDQMRDTSVDDSSLSFDLVKVTYSAFVNDGGFVRLFHINSYWEPCEAGSLTPLGQLQQLRDLVVPANMFTCDREEARLRRHAHEPSLGVGTTGQSYPANERASPDIFDTRVSSLSAKALPLSLGLIPPEPATSGSTCHGLRHCIPRPLNAFMCFRSVWSQQMRSVHHGSRSGVTQQVISGEASRVWHEMDEASKRPYVEMAQKYKDNYVEMWSHDHSCGCPLSGLDSAVVETDLLSSPDTDCGVLSSTDKLEYTYGRDDLPALRETEPVHGTDLSLLAVDSAGFGDSTVIPVSPAVFTQDIDREFDYWEKQTCCYLSDDNSSATLPRVAVSSLTEGCGDSLIRSYVGAAAQMPGIPCQYVHDFGYFPEDDLIVCDDTNAIDLQYKTTMEHFLYTTGCPPPESDRYSAYCDTGSSS